VGAGENQPRRRRLAVVTTVWRERSHAWHMAERFLHGYPTSGRWHRPAFEVVSAYVDQTPRGDAVGFPRRPPATRRLRPRRRRRTCGE
jgi:hypothetical protein